MNHNIGYVHEIAGRIMIAQHEGDAETVSSLREMARKHQVSEIQLRDASATLGGLPDQSEEGIDTFVRGVFLKDARDRGYLGNGHEPSLWALGQMAWKFYGQ